MKIRAKIQTPYKTLVSPQTIVDIPFLQETLDTLIEIESLNVIDCDNVHQNFILVGSTSKKLKTLQAEIVLAFKKRGAFVDLTFLEIKMSPTDTNPSKRL